MGSTATIRHVGGTDGEHKVLGSSNLMDGIAVCGYDSRQRPGTTRPV